MKMGQGRRGRTTDNSDCRTGLINKVWAFILDFSSLVEITQVVRRKTILSRTKSHCNKISRYQRNTHYWSYPARQKTPRDCRNNYKWMRKHILRDHQWLNPMPIVKMNWQMTPRIQYLIQANKENPPKGCTDIKVTVRSE